MSLFSWLLQARTDVAEIQNGLRSTLFRRMSSLIAAAVNGFVIVCIAAYRHPTPLFLSWLIIDATLVASRLLVVVLLMRMMKRGGQAGRSWMVDGFIGSSLIWYVQIGMGGCFCMASGDLVLGVFGALLVAGTAGAACARNPGAPRMTTALMVLITSPLALGSLFNPDPQIHLVVLLVPAYVWGCSSINWQLHNDYLNMLVAEQKVRHLALHCGMTGLPNRSHFNERLGAALQDPSQHPVAVLCLDLDGFKSVNDSHGHLAGDMLLQQVAARIERCSPSSALAARMGGDEFAVMTRRQSRGAVGAMAGLLIAEISLPYQLPGGIEVTVGVSIGLSTYKGDVIDPVALLVQADRALYVAKRAGKGVCRSYEPEPETVRPGGDVTA